MASIPSTAIPGGRRYVTPTGDRVWLWPAEDRRFLQTVRAALHLQPTVDAQDADPSPQGVACISLADPGAEAIIGSLRQAFPEVTILGIGPGDGTNAHQVLSDQAEALAAGFADALHPSRRRIRFLPKNKIALALVALIAALWLPFPGSFFSSSDVEAASEPETPPAAQTDLEIRARLPTRGMAPPDPLPPPTLVSGLAATPGKILKLSVQVGTVVRADDVLGTLELADVLQQARSLRDLALEKEDWATRLRAQASRITTEPRPSPVAGDDLGPSLEQAWVQAKTELDRFEVALASLPPEALTQGLRRAHRGVLERAFVAKQAWESHQTKRALQWAEQARQQEEAEALEASLSRQRLALLERANMVEEEVETLREEAATLSTSLLVSLTAPSSGVVREILVSVGDSVSRGDVWIVLQSNDPSPR